MAGDFTTVLALPFELDFDRTRGGMIDKDGQSHRLHLRPAQHGRQRIPAVADRPEPRRGAAEDHEHAATRRRAGTSARTTRSRNGLQMQFYAGKAWTITHAAEGPAELPRQAGRAGRHHVRPRPGQLRQARRRRRRRTARASSSSTSRRPAAAVQRNLGPSSSLTNIGSFSSIQTLDLIMSGDPADAHDPRVLPRQRRPAREAVGRS